MRFLLQPFDQRCGVEHLVRLDDSLPTASATYQSTITTEKVPHRFSFSSLLQSRILQPFS